MRVIAALGAILITAVCGNHAEATIAVDQFSDTTASAGITYVGSSWGAAWGDFDNDGLPDIWLVNHYNPPSLYRNLGDGTFSDVTTDLLPAAFTQGSYDSHGAVWADFDADGDLDLFQTADGGTLGLYSSLLFVQNSDGLFTEMAADFGLDFPQGRGRMPLWLDYDRDGKLDLLTPTTRLPGTGDDPTALFRQGTDGFIDVADAAGLVPNATGNCDFVLLADLNNDGQPELLPNRATFPDRVYEMSGPTFQNIRYDIGLGSTYQVIDAAVADLDGDLENEIYLVRGESTRGLVQVDPNTLEAHFRDEDNTERGITFATTGDIVIGVWPTWKWSLNKVFIGASAAHPGDHSIALSPADTATWGTPPHGAGDPGLFIGYDSNSGYWTVTRSKTLINIVVISSTPITVAEPVGWDPAELPPTDRFLDDDGNFFQDQTVAAGIPMPSSGRSVVAADFDNDMDLDLYIVSTGPVANQPNILYENDGAGNFTPVVGAGGAAGSLDGRGDNATVADYDRDGYLDLLVTNGVSKPPFDYDGPTQLFHNQGGENHWLEIDLVGTASNRDGIGAQLVLTTGGVAQVCSQDAGIHYRGQNHQRVHFGLGSNSVVDELRVTWPSGIVQILTEIPADQVIAVMETSVSPVPNENLPTGQPELLGCNPNPFNPSTTISFDLPDARSVSLTVYDVAGRSVRRLLQNNPRPAGRNQVIWDGKNQLGQAVPSGVYFSELRSGEWRGVVRMLLLQ